MVPCKGAMTHRNDAIVSSLIELKDNNRRWSMMEGWNDPANQRVAEVRAEKRPRKRKAYAEAWPTVMMTIQLTRLCRAGRSNIAKSLACQALCLKRPSVQGTNTSVAQNARFSNTFYAK